MKINKLNYLTYQRYEIVGTFLTTMVWTSLGTFCLVTKSKIEIDILTFLEAVVFICSVLGTYIAFKRIGTLKLYSLMLIITETLFMIAIIYLTYIKSDMIAFSIYTVIIINKLIYPIINEKERNIEDILFNKQREKKLFADIRMRNNYFTNIAGVIGSLTAVLIVSILNINVYTFAIYMLVFNVIQNMIDYYKWYKYLK